MYVEVTNQQVTRTDLHARPCNKAIHDLFRQSIIIRTVQYAAEGGVKRLSRCFS